MPSAAFTRYKVTVNLPGHASGATADLDPDDPKVKKWVANRFLVPLEVVRKPDAPAPVAPKPKKTPQNRSDDSPRGLSVALESS